MLSLGEQIAGLIEQATQLKSLDVCLMNAERNRPLFETTIEDLTRTTAKESDGAAIVIVGGPSLHRKKPVHEIARIGFTGDIIVADGALGYCLRNGLVPDFVVTLDPHPYRIIRWFGDPDLSRRPKDDYFSRQDLDPEHWKNEVEANQQLLELVNKYGKQIKAIVSTSTDPDVARRCREAGMKLYWWNPLLDDYTSPGSKTKSLHHSNGITCMVTGGNVGTAAWVFAHSVLHRKHVALVGMDLSYAPGTPYENTQYHAELKELFHDNLEGAFIHVRNPYLDEVWYTDPTYFWYRKVFLDLACEAECTTYNCTEGGILFGEPIRFLALREFLESCQRTIVPTRSGGR